MLNVSEATPTMGNRLKTPGSQACRVMFVDPDPNCSLSMFVAACGESDLFSNPCGVSSDVAMSTAPSSSGSGIDCCTGNGLRGIVPIRCFDKTIARTEKSVAEE
jgi:hypothetical protein